MSSIEVFEWAMQHTLNNVQERIDCENPFPPWLKKQVEGIHLMVTNWKAGKAWYRDGLMDERDVYRGIRDSRYNSRIDEIEDAIRDVDLDGPGDDDDEMQETEQHG